NPGIGRWLSPDPTVPNPYNGQSLNRYSYVLNNPLTFVDPIGYCANGPGNGHPCKGVDCPADGPAFCGAGGFPPGMSFGGEPKPFLMNEAPSGPFRCIGSKCKKQRKKKSTFCVMHIMADRHIGPGSPPGQTTVKAGQVIKVQATTKALLS